MKKALKWDESRGNGEKLKGQGRVKSNIHKDAKNCIIMDEWKGSRLTSEREEAEEAGGLWIKS